MSIKDKEIHDTLIKTGLLPETISMEQHMKGLRTLKAEMEIQHYKEMQNMVRLDEAEDIIEKCNQVETDFQNKFLYLISFLDKNNDPEIFEYWDNIFLTAIEKQKQALQP